MKLENEQHGIKSIVQLYKEKESIGTAEITRYEFKDDFLFNIRASRGHPMFMIKNGIYCRLKINDQLVMSDTGMERYSNIEFITKANGKVLIAGLGLGLILHNILNKKNILEIIVIENNNDVIKLVQPKFKDSRLKIINADIFKWEPKPKENFDTIYFDIWPDICTDNLNDIQILHNKFKSYLNKNNPNKYMNSWLKEYLQHKNRSEY